MPNEWDMELWDYLNQPLNISESCLPSSKCQNSRLKKTLATQAHYDDNRLAGFSKSRGSNVHKFQIWTPLLKNRQFFVKCLIAPRGWHVLSQVNDASESRDSLTLSNSTEAVCQPTPLLPLHPTPGQAGVVRKRSCVCEPGPNSMCESETCVCKLKISHQSSHTLIIMYDGSKKWVK